MQFRDRMSTSARYGFRVTGMRISRINKSGTPSPRKVSAPVCGTRDGLRWYSDRPRRSGSTYTSFFVHDGVRRRTQLLREYVQLLRSFRRDLCASSSFMKNEFIGTSLLLLDKNARPVLKWIDFPMFTSRHGEPWRIQPAKDGIVDGLSELIRIAELELPIVQYVRNEEEEAGVRRFFRCSARYFQFLHTQLKNNESAHVVLRPMH